jgi:hypothetical protein
MSTNDLENLFCAAFPGKGTALKKLKLYTYWSYVLFWHVYVLGLGYFSYDLGHRTGTADFVTSQMNKKTKVIRCGACYYSIVVNTHRVTSMADTDIDAVRKQKKAQYDKQYRLKRKLLLQQQASKDIYMIRYFHP